MGACAAKKAAYALAILLLSKRSGEAVEDAAGSLELRETLLFLAKLAGM